MKSLTVWAPWAHLIMIGAKPFEFRRWDYREREAALEGQRIVIHSGTRPMKREEIEEMLAQVRSGETSLRGGVRTDSALPLLEKVITAFDACDAAMPAYKSAMALHRRSLRKPRMVGDENVPYPSKPEVGVLPLGHGLGTALLGKPRRVTDLFKGYPDSDRLDHHMWAWPLTDLEPFEPPIPMRGAQGFWTWPERIAA